MCSSRVVNVKWRYWREAEHMTFNIPHPSGGPFMGKSEDWNLRGKTPHNGWHKYFKWELSGWTKEGKNMNIFKRKKRHLIANIADDLEIKRAKTAGRISLWLRGKQAVISQHLGDNKVERLATLAPVKIPAACLKSGKEEHRLLRGWAVAAS